MAKREVLGHMECPACEHDAAEIKLQKCGVKLYLYCPECNVQIFARTPAQEKRMRAHLDAKSGVPAVKVEVPAVPEKVEKVEEPAAKPIQKPVPKSEKKITAWPFG